MLSQDAQAIYFEVTEQHMETGLRGIPVGYCVTSTVNPQKGLFYHDFPVSELANWEPEDVIYLLYKGSQGSEGEVSQFWGDLKKRASLKEKTIEAIEALPREGHPMKLFCCALLICGMLEGKGDYREDCLNLIAKIPHIVSTVINHHAGWGRGVAPDTKLSYMENFAQMVNVPNANKEELGKVFKLFNVLHYDHGGGNLSAFTGKCVASGLEDMYGSIASAMAALAGPRHGKANQDCLEFVKLLNKELGDSPTTEQVEAVIRKRLENKELVFGFGHAVLRVEDPRATVQYALASEKYGNDPLVKTALALREAGSKVLKENPKIANPYPNVDAISGTLLTAAGFPFPEYYTVLFGLSRVVGISMQIVYERLEAREGKGTPIVRPKYLYKKKSPA